MAKKAAGTAPVQASLNNEDKMRALDAALSQIEKQYGSLKEQKLTMSELEASLADGEALLTRLAAEAKEASP